MTEASPFVVLLLVAAALPAACNPREPPSATTRPPAKETFDLAAVRRVIEEANARFTKAHVAGDVATIDAMFTRDASSFPPGAPPAGGGGEVTAR